MSGSIHLLLSLVVLVMILDVYGDKDIKSSIDQNSGGREFEEYKDDKPKQVSKIKKRLKNNKNQKKANSNIVNKKYSSKNRRKNSIISRNKSSTESRKKNSTRSRKKGSAKSRKKKTSKTKLKVTKSLKKPKSKKNSDRKQRRKEKFDKWTNTLDGIWKNIKQDKSCECGLPNPGKKGTRIVNGVEAAPHSLPWQISMQDNTGFWYCGGSVLCDEWILTAAHCVHSNGVTDDPSTVFISIGDHDVSDPNDSKSEIMPVSKIIPHEKYDEDTTNNDIALIRLKKKIDFKKFKGTVRPICLPESPKRYYGETVKVSGWGLLYDGGDGGSKVLREVDVSVIPMKSCRENFKYKREWITNKMLCANAPNQDSCQPGWCSILGYRMC
ncbi:serine proteinase stubble isoform X2 [Eurytemora carolleeae]|uniref:serine proteinase stubble isoform X2 n=1 Tax=Eurytemora carolleeae TaxID=1294199 RepID=UPI000C763A5C|nr:serine proteinase stubble isoform X2 [Eurytemora carolleeae]|eukprot:XP_023336165.1 serine proteinase stubble-like isoform X2 [Eurytemora affinis]